MEKDAETNGFRSAIPVVILCVSIALAALFSDGGITRFLGPSKSELAQKRQEFHDSRNLLLLQLSICQRNISKANDAYICPSSSKIYSSLGSGLMCQLAEEVAQELGLNGPRDFSITQNTTTATPVGLKR